MNEQELLAEIERLKKLSVRRTVKQAFKDAYKRWFDIMISPEDASDSVGVFAVFSSTIMIAVILVIVWIVSCVKTHGLCLVLPLVYPIWFLFRREE